MSKNKIFSTNGLVGLFALLAVGVAGYFGYQAYDTSPFTAVDESQTKTTTAADQANTPVSGDKTNQPSVKTYQPTLNPDSPASVPVVQPQIEGQESDETPAAKDDPIDCPTINDEPIPGC